MKASVRPVEDLGESVIRAMYDVFRRYYADVSPEQFAKDLQSKDRVVLIHDSTGSVAGFSTVAIHDFHLPSGPIRVVYSGDTIIDRRNWGSQVFAFAWIRETGRIKAEAPELPLYWLLISKGYRTYRYLEAFGLAFTPDWRGVEHPELDVIKDEIAAGLFGDDYDPSRGVVSRAEPRGRLAPEWAKLTERERARPDVRFFIARNPHYGRGEELVCLCALEEENMKPLTRRNFRQGLHG